MTTTPPRRGLPGAIRIAWFLVLAMMLAAAAWSISGQLHRWGMATWLAWALSLTFDFAGLICAEYSRRAIERNTAAGLPRLALLTFVSVSGALNFAHGRELGGWPAAYGLGAISGGVELLFELHRRDLRDEQRSERGLVAERLPHIPMLAWLMFPIRSWTTLRGAIGARLDTIDPLQQASAPAVEQAVTASPTPAEIPSAPASTLALTAAVAAPPQHPAAPVAQPASMPAVAPPTPAVAQPVAASPTPAPPVRAPYDDPRHEIIRQLYDAGHRPSSGQMADAVQQGGYDRPAPSSARTMRQVIEAVEPVLATLSSAPLTLRRTAS